MSPENKPQEPVISDDELKIPDSASTKPTNDTHLTALLGVLIIVLILILAGLYLWSTTFTTPDTVPTPDNNNRPTAAENNEPESTNAEAEVATMNAMSNSTNLDTIAADLESTDLDNLDAELTTIDNELNAAQ